MFESGFCKKYFFKKIRCGNRKLTRETDILTPDVYAPAGLFQLFRGDDGLDGQLVDIAAGRSPSLQKVLGPVSRTVACLPPVGDEFARHFERVAVVQADLLLLAAERAALTLVLLLDAAAAAARRAVVIRIIHWVLYAA